jgi:thiopeptide-type bacteriocin biosynthesis protein
MRSRPLERSEAATVPSGGPGGLYRPLEFFMARAPLLPLDSYPAANLADDDASPPGELPLLRDGRVLRALAVSSLPLTAALARPARKPRDQERLRSSLRRYAIRMATRPTPFGLSAGAALGVWGAATDLRIADAPAAVHARPDMVGLLRLVTELESRPEVRRGLRVVASPAVHLRGGRVFLSGVESQRGVTGAENVSMRATGAVRRALGLAREAIAYQELAEALLATVPAATAEKIEELLRQLWLHEFLVTDLRPPLTAGDPARYVAERLREVPAASDVRGDLERLLDGIDAWTALPAREGAARYPALAAEVNAVMGLESKTPLQVDMILPLAGRQVAAVVADEAVRAAELLLRLAPFPDGIPSIVAYRQAFEARFGVDRDVPLLELLDAGSSLGVPPEAAARPATGTALRDQTLLAMAAAALHDRRTSVELDEETLGRLQLWTPSPQRAPVSLDLYALVAAPSAAAVDAGDFRLVVGPNVGATAAGRNLGRFADMLGPEATAALAELARAEERLLPGTVLAELVCLPEKMRTANVVVRPLVRSFEVGLPASAHRGTARFIPLDELFVRVRLGRFALIWRDGRGEPREVTACAGHMLNHVRAPAVCRFLADLSRDGMALLNGFDWGPARTLPFLPRVQAGRCVLSLAQWRIDAVNGGPALRGRSREGFPDAFARWRERWRVPRHVFLSTSADAADHRLLLDLADAGHVDEIRREVGRIPERGGVVLQEACPGLDEAWVTGPGGRYSMELVVSMIRRDATPAAPVRPPSPSVPPAARMRPPGSDWSYVKLYGERAAEDPLIAGPLRAFASSMDAAGLTDQWMMLRYADPEPHLRLRLHGDADRLVPALCEWAAQLMADRVVSHFVLDTYDREVERYGGLAGMSAAEAIFAADSRAVAELLHLELDGESPLDRLALAMVGVDDLLAGLGLEEAARLGFYQLQAGGLHDAGAVYRQRKKELCGLLRQPLLADLDDAGAVRDALARRRSDLEQAAATLRELTRRGELGRTLPELCHSYVHLHCNRLLGGERRLERQVFELLLRTRRALAAGA